MSTRPKEENLKSKRRKKSSKKSRAKDSEREHRIVSALEEIKTVQPFSGTDLHLHPSEAGQATVNITQDPKPAFPDIDLGFLGKISGEKMSCLSRPAQLLQILFPSDCFNSSQGGVEQRFLKERAELQSGYRYERSKQRYHERKLKKELESRGLFPNQPQAPSTSSISSASSRSSAADLPRLQTVIQSENEGNVSNHDEMDVSEFENDPDCNTTGSTLTGPSPTKSEEEEHGKDDVDLRESNFETKTVAVEDNPEIPVCSLVRDGGAEEEKAQSCREELRSISIPMEYVVPVNPIVYSPETEPAPLSGAGSSDTDDLKPSYERTHDPKPLTENSQNHESSLEYECCIESTCSNNGSVNDEVDAKDTEAANSDHDKNVGSEVGAVSPSSENIQENPSKESTLDAPSEKPATACLSDDKIIEDEPSVQSTSIQLTEDQRINPVDRDHNNIADVPTSAAREFPEIPTTRQTDDDSILAIPSTSTSNVLPGNPPLTTSESPESPNDRPVAVPPGVSILRPALAKSMSMPLSASKTPSSQSPEISIISKTAGRNIRELADQLFRRSNDEHSATPTKTSRLSNEIKKSQNSATSAETTERTSNSATMRHLQHAYSEKLPSQSSLSRTLSASQNSTTANLQRFSQTNRPVQGHIQHTMQLLQESAEHSHVSPSSERLTSRPPSKLSLTSSFLGKVPNQ